MEHVNHVKTPPDAAPSSCASYIGLLWRILWMMAGNLYCGLGVTFHMACLLPVRLISRKHFYYLEGLVSHCGNTIVASVLHSAGCTVEETGDDITKCTDEVSLLLVNHQCPADILVMMYALSNKGKFRLGIMWIIFKLFKWTHFGISCQVRKDFFVAQGRAARDKTRGDFESHIKRNFIPLPHKKCVIMFPEGGFLCNNRERTARFAKKNDLPQLQNVVYPRAGGTKVLMGTMSHSECGDERSLKWIIDVTLGYPDGKEISTKSLIFSDRGPCKITLLYRVWHVSELPQDEDKLNEWMRDQWLLKEKLLDCYYKTGKYPDLANQKPVSKVILNNNSELSKPVQYLETRDIPWSTTWAFFCHVIFIFAFSIECYLMYWTVNYMFLA